MTSIVPSTFVSASTPSTSSPLNHMEPSTYFPLWTVSYSSGSVIFPLAENVSYLAEARMALSDLFVIFKV